MGEYPNTQELRAQEKIINLIESIQAVPRSLWALLVLSLLLIFPVTRFLPGILSQVFISAYSPPAIIYEPPIAVPLDIRSAEFFTNAESQVFAYVRVFNPNGSLALRTLPYEFQLVGNSGQTLTSYNGESYILPGQEKLIFMPLRSVGQTVSSVRFSPMPETWSYIPDFFPVSFSFENQNFGVTAEGQSFAEGLLVNDSPYFITQVELGVLLYSLENNVSGANFTTLNTLDPRERRYFRVSWEGSDIGQNASRVEFLPSVKQLQKGVVSTESAPADTRDFLR